jgi:aminomuconate-semialdehyde/2-hydroxymuconate-6-semialdehyde dehydrogenase
LVQEDIYDKFIERFVAETKKLVVGDPFDPKTTVGALVSEEHRRRVESYIEIAKEEGGEILTGGERPQNLDDRLKNGYYLLPTIITDLTSDCRVQQEEIFGPVVGITKFKTVEEAIEMANSTKYGLAAILWTENLRNAHTIAHELEAGTVWVNCWMLRDLRMPFGGVKHSGLGRASGTHSIDFYTEQKTICIKF